MTEKQQKALTLFMTLRQICQYTGLTYYQIKKIMKAYPDKFPKKRMIKNEIEDEELVDSITGNPKKPRFYYNGPEVKDFFENVYWAD